MFRSRSQRFRPSVSINVYQSSKGALSIINLYHLLHYALILLIFTYTPLYCVIFTFSAAQMQIVLVYQELLITITRWRYRMFFGKVLYCRQIVELIEINFVCKSIVLSFPHYYFLKLTYYKKITNFKKFENILRKLPILISEKKDM